MCCFFGCNNQPNCTNRIPARCPRGLAGPVGPRGPIGPQGATGASGTSNIIYAGVNSSTTIATNTIIPITQLASTANGSMSVSSNAVNLPEAGSYLVSYYVNGSVPSGDLIYALYLNGSALSGESITMTNTAGSSSAAGKTILITTTAAGTLSVYNLSAETVTLSSATITVLKSG